MVGYNVPQTVVATILVGLVVASVSTMAFAGGRPESPRPVTHPEWRTVRDQRDVDAWERSIVTLRADDDGAAYTLPNAGWRIESPSGDQASLNRDPVPVYDNGQTVRMTFDPDRAQKADDYLADQKTQLIAAHLDETGNGDVPRTTAEAFDLLRYRQRRRRERERLVLRRRRGELASGENEYTDSVEAGHTVYFLVTVKDGDGVQVAKDGDVTGVDGDVTVVGMEHVVARAGGNSRRPSKVRPGKTASFDVDASELEAADAGHTINQGVVVYDEETYVNQRFLIELNDNVSGDFDVDEDATFHSDVDEGQRRRSPRRPGQHLRPPGRRRPGDRKRRPRIHLRLRRRASRDGHARCRRRLGGHRRPRRVDDDGQWFERGPDRRGRDVQELVDRRVPLGVRWHGPGQRRHGHPDRTIKVKKSRRAVAPAVTRAATPAEHRW